MPAFVGGLPAQLFGGPSSPIMQLLGLSSQPAPTTPSGSSLSLICFGILTPPAPLVLSRGFEMKSSMPSAAGKAKLNALHATT